MIRRSGILFLTLAGAALAKDANQPVKPGALELGLGYGYAYFPGAYNADGAYQDWEDLRAAYPQIPADYNPGLSGIPLRAKYGLGGGLDLKAEWDAAFYNKDAGSLKGMGQPRLGIRYNGPVAGLFSTVTLPFATGDLDNGNLKTYLQVGGVLRRRIERFRLTATASYTDNFDQYHLISGSLKPEFIWDAHTSAYGIVSYLSTRDRDSYWWLLTPGVRSDLSTALALEVTAPFTFAGRNAPAVWTLQGIFYWTFGG